jgi:cystathionine beta-lyase/cystathionine gamma-synthase
LAKAQMDGFGAIVTFRLNGGNDQVSRLVKALKLFLFAESLGGVESLICHPATMSHGTLTAQERQQVGITDGTIRLSIGIEDERDLIEDLEQALAVI